MAVGHSFVVNGRGGVPISTAMVEGDATPAEGPLSEILELLHFNDVYEVEAKSREPVGGVARFITKLRQYPDAVVLFSGDSLAPSLMSTVTKGIHMVKFLNMMNIRAACIGNHDFDFGVDHMEEECVNKTNFPWMLSNAWDKSTGKRLAGGLDCVVVEHGGRKIGLMGLIEEEWLCTLATIEIDEIIYRDFVEVARELIPKLREQGCDCIVALTHMRSPNDRRLAREVPEIDLILGGHDHECIHEVVDGIPVIKSGTDFRNLTRIFMDFSLGPRPAITWEVLEITGEVEEEPEAAVMVEEYREELAKSMDKVIGELGCTMDAKFAHIRTRETNCGNWIADCVRDGFHNVGIPVDAVIINSGTLRADDVFPPGPFLLRDLVTLLPMLDELCVLALKGSDLLDALENGVSMYPKLEGRFPCISGIRFEFDPNQPAGQRVIQESVRVRDLLLDVTQEYKVVTKAYVASGKDGYQCFTKGRIVADGESSPLLPDLIRSQFSTLQSINEQLAQNNDCNEMPQQLRDELLDNIHKNIHIGTQSHKGDSTAIDARASTADLEDLLHGADGDPDHKWPFASPSHRHPVRIHGRFQVFAMVDGRIRCRTHGIKPQLISSHA